MSTAAAEDAGAPAKKGSKKLIIIIAAVAVLLLGGGGAAFYVIKKKQAEAEAVDEDGEPVRAAKDDHAKKKDDHKTPPTFVALDPFTVNLSDKEAERYAQIGVTLEVDDAHFADEMKAYLPAIRAGILMVLAHKSAAELLEREGKEKLAREIMRVSVKPMGIEIEDEEDEAPEEAPAASDKPKKKKKKKKAAEHNPVQQVLFSSFIIQ
jgi:flagellar FliL protein